MFYISKSLKTQSIPVEYIGHINGKLFELNADINEYCNYITNLFAKYLEYEKLAISAFNEYEYRLNWTVSGRTVKNWIMECVNN